jgi:RimJ/RimL family protein N-acetyltransferase
MTDTRVSRLSEDDWAVFAALRLRALADAFGDDHEQYRHEQRFGETEWRYRIAEHTPFAAWHNGRPVGMIAAHRDGDDTVYLYSLWLDPTARGHGIAAELLTATLDWARSLRARSVHLRVAVDNAAARSVYERFGFTAQETTADHELLMSLSMA